MTSYDWASTRDDAIDRFHESPGAALEERVLAHFRETPGKVRTLIASIGGRVAEGKVHHGWAILDRELAVIVADVVADDLAEQARAIITAEAWIRNAGGYIDREEELVDALFGVPAMTPDVGFLERLDVDTVGAPGRYMYAGLLEATIVRTRLHGLQEVPGSREGGLLSRFDSPGLRARMVGYWRERRPRFEEAEAEAVRRQAVQAEALARLRKQPARPERWELDPDVAAKAVADGLAFYDTIELPEEATA